MLQMVRHPSRKLIGKANSIGRLDAVLCRKKEKLGQSKSNAVTIKNVLLHLIKYKGDKITMAQVDKAYCEDL